MALLALCACDVEAQSQSAAGGAEPEVAYAGSWQFVRGVYDGRYSGSSARSYHRGDAVSIIFSGRRLRIYGVRGPNGGRATLIIPGRRARVLSFYAPAYKSTHALIYDSGAIFRGGVQTVGIVVNGAPGGTHEGYVNIEEFEVTR